MQNTSVFLAYEAGTVPFHITHFLGPLPSPWNFSGLKNTVGAGEGAQVEGGSECRRRGDEPWEVSHCGKSAPENLVAVSAMTPSTIPYESSQVPDEVASGSALRSYPVIWTRNYPWKFAFPLQVGP